MNRARCSEATSVLTFLPSPTSKPSLLVTPNNESYCCLQVTSDFYSIGAGAGGLELMWKARKGEQGLEPGSPRSLSVSSLWSTKPGDLESLV